MVQKTTKCCTCQLCGKIYIVRGIDFGKEIPNEILRTFCYTCQEWLLDECEKYVDNERRTKQRKIDQDKNISFEEELKEWNVINISDISVIPGKTLYMVGNGFDIMHGVKSSYYNFRKFLGRKSPLRTELESHWKPEDIWANFEENLAYFDINSMAGRYIVDAYLDGMEAYKEDASMASFCTAVEFAASPMIKVVTELTKMLYKWMQTLSPATNERPLTHLFVDGKVLNFNYTEFANTLYGVPLKDICFIHGSRLDRKQRLILGHQPSASRNSFELHERKRRIQTYKDYLLELAQERVIALVASYDENLSKDTKSIIKKHSTFFNSLSGTKDIVVIGHSLSKVDWDYFIAVAEHVENKERVKWHFGIYGYNDLSRMKELVKTLGLNTSQVEVFRTDSIQVKFIEEHEKTSRKQKPPMQIASSMDGKWTVVKQNKSITIAHSTNPALQFHFDLPLELTKAWFEPTTIFLFLFVGYYSPSLILFFWNGESWNFQSELVSSPHQGVLNQRLKQVYLAENVITFVYNNRVTRFSLSNGVVTEDRTMRNAGKLPHPEYGADVTEIFVTR